MKTKIVTMLMILSLSFFQTARSHEHHQERDTAHLSVSEKQMEENMKMEMANHQQMEAVNAFPNYHPLIVHFPIVLILMAALFQLLSFFFFRKEFSIVTLILLFLGVLTSWLASNPLHAMPNELSGRAKDIFEVHERMAMFTWWFSLTALLIKSSSFFIFKSKHWMEMIAATMLIAAAVTVSIAGHHGSMLVHMEGIGPMGKYLETDHIHVDRMEMPIQNSSITARDSNEKGNNNELPEIDHHVGEPGKGPHSGIVEEADPYHIEMVIEGDDLNFYLLDENTNPVEMEKVNGNVRISFFNTKQKTIELKLLGDKLTGMHAMSGKPILAFCTIKNSGKEYSATFRYFNK